MIVDQQRHPMPKRLQFTARARETTRFAAVSTLGLVVVIVAVTALLVRGGSRGTAMPPQNPAVLAAQDQSTSKAVSTPVAVLEASVAWELQPQLLQYGSFRQPVISGNRVFQQVMFDSGDDSLDFSGIRALDIDSGDVIWQQALNWSRAGMDVDEHGVYSVVGLQTIDARDPATGDVLWTLDLSFPIASTILDNGILYVWDSYNRLSAVNTETGTIIWQSERTTDTPYETEPDGVPRSSDLKVGGNVVVAIDADNTVNAFSLTGGAVAWSIPDLDWHYAIMYTTGDTLLVVLPPDTAPATTEVAQTAPDRKAIGVDMFTGKTIWEVKATDPFDWSGSPRGEGKFYLAATDVKTTVQNADPIVDTPGCVVWPEWTPTAAERQNFFEGSQQIFALDAATGQIDWQQSTRAGDFYGLGGATSAGIWAVTADQQIVLLSADTGALLAQPVVLQGESVNGLFSGPSDDRVVISGRGGILIGIRTDPI